MVDHTKDLMKIWKTDNLSFIAIFKRYKEREGFLNDFLNPLTLKKIYYPQIDGTNIDNRQVSFYLPIASDLQDGYYYKVDLEFSEKSSKSNNPYSLSVQNIALLDQEGNS